MSSANTYIPFARHQLTVEDKKAVRAVLDRDYLTRGPKREEFEQALCEWTGAEYAIAVSSGTAALHLAYWAMNISQGDQICTSPLTFAGTVNPALLMGANLQLVDIDKEYHQLDLSRLEQQFQDHPEQTPKVVVPVSYGGKAYDLERLHALSQEYGFAILADQCHALGATYQDSTGKQRTVGDAQFADCEIFSFHALKHVTTGEGGTILTNDESLFERMSRLRNNGIGQVGKPGYRYEVQETGLNYHLTEFQAALGISQLRRLPEHIEKRRRLSQRYRKRIEQQLGEQVEILVAGSEEDHAAHLLVVGVPQRDRVHEMMNELGVGTNVHYWPLYRHKAYQSESLQSDQFPQCESFADQALSLPLYPDLTESQVDHVVEILAKALKAIR